MAEQLRIYLLGEFSVVRADEPVAAKEWHTRQARQLLKLLLTERGHTVPAERIIEALWPDHSENAAKTLRSAINALRAVLEPGRPAHSPSRYIITRYSGYSFAPLEPETVWIDVAEFECGLDACFSQTETRPTAPIREKLARTLELYRGDYLSEDLYEEWAGRERERLRERYLQGLEKLADWQASAGELAAAIETCRHAVTYDNCREPVYRALMTYQAQQGDMAGALQSFERCRRTLDQELGADPSPQTLELHQALLNGGWAIGVRGWGIGAAKWKNQYQSSVISYQSSVISPHLSSLPFIGRESEIEWLGERLQEAQAGRGNTITLVGEAGIGKTFLAQRLLEQARAQGAKTLTISCQAIEQTLPFAPVVAALSSFLRQLPDEELAFLSPATLAQAALLLPILRDRRPDLPTPPDSNSEENRSRLINGLGGLFEEIAHCSTLALFCDDAHWADEATLLLFNRLTRLTEQNRLLLLVAYRSEDLSENETLHLMLRYLSRDRLVQPLLLQRFTPAEVAQFLNLQKNEPSLSAADLYQATQGNALFLAEAIRTLTESDETTRLEEEPYSSSIVNRQSSIVNRQSVRWLLRSPQIRDVVLARLARLGKTERRVLELAATIGRPFAPELLQVTLPPEEWGSLEILLERRFLVQQHEGRLAFSHEVVREVVHEECSPLIRHHLHRRIADGLTRLHGGNPESHAAEMVFHFKRAGAGSERELLHYAVAAGDYSRRTFSYRYALTYYDEALETAQKLGSALTQDEETRRCIGQAYQGRGLAYEALLDWEGVRETYRRLSKWAEAGGDMELAESCERRLSMVRALMGHLEEAAAFSLARATNTLLRSVGHTPPALLDLMTRSGTVLEPPTPESYNSNLKTQNSKLSSWPPFCVPAPVEGQPWKELPETLGTSQAALLLFQYGWALLLQGRPEAEPCLNAALVAAEETGQVACWVLVALQLSHLHLMRGDFAAVDSWLKRCLSRGEQAPEAAWATIWPQIFRAYLLLGNGAIEKAQELFRRLQTELATRDDFYSHRYSVEIGLGMVARRLGDNERAAELLQAALNAPTKLYADTYVLALTNMAWIDFERGEVEMARERLRQNLVFCGRRSLLVGYAQTSTEIARLELLAGGNLAPVEALLRHTHQLATEAGYYNVRQQTETTLAEVLAVAAAHR